MTKCAGRRSRFQEAAETMRVGKALRSSRDVCSPFAGDRRRIAREAGTEAGQRRHAGDPARSLRALHVHAGAGWSDARKDCAGSPASAAHRSSRGRRVLLAGTEGLIRDAAQAKSHHVRADLRTGTPSSRQRNGGDGKRRAVARTGHFALVRGTHHFPGLDDSHRTTCWTRRLLWSIGSSSIRNACRKTSN